MICSLKEIVLSVQSAVPDNWQVSWLIDPRITSAFPNKTLFSGLLRHIFRCVSYVHRICVSRFLMRCAPFLEVYSLITVTRSYRNCTCFPFHQLRHILRCVSTDTNYLPYETFPILAHSAFVYNNVLQNQRIKHSDHCKCHAGISGQCK